MRSFIGILVSLLLVALVAAQRAVMVDPGTGEIVYPPNFWLANDEWMPGSSNGAALNRTNLGLGWPALTNTNSGTALLAMREDGEIVYSQTNVEPYIIDRINISARGNFEGYFYVTSQDAIQFQTDQGYDTAGITRTNLQIPWSGLTNTTASNFHKALFPNTNTAPSVTNAVNG